MKAATVPQFIALIERLVDILAKQDLTALERSGFLGPSTAAEYFKAVNEYLRGRAITPIPAANLDDIELYPSKDAQRLRADVDLWVDSQCSDLTAVVYFDLRSDTQHPLQLYDLRVL